MRITAWRIINKKHAAKAFSGEGAKLFGGRWNPPGHAAVYTADSLSLAILELIVHLDEDRDIQDYVAIPLEFEEAQIITWPEEMLPKNWSSLPVSDQTQNMGKMWLEEKQSMVLKVPSSVVHHDSNFVINPLHPDFSSLKMGQPQTLQIDPRLAAKLQ
jgi:RES domain-containing protein